MGADSSAENTPNTPNTTLLYGYSLIIAKNFVTVYTAFDY